MIFKFHDQFLAHTCLQREIEIEGAQTLGGALEELFNRYPQLLIFMTDDKGEEAKKTSFRLNGEYVWKSEETKRRVSDGDVLEFGREVPEGSGAVGKIIAGVVLIVAAVVMAAFTAGGSFALSSYMIGGSLTMIGAVGVMGVGLVLSGVAEAIIGTPKIGTGNTNTSSPTYSSFEGIKNTTAIGTTVGLVYGLHRVGGHLLNVYTDVVDTDTYLYAQIGLCEGEIDGWVNKDGSRFDPTKPGQDCIEINGNPISFYDPSSYQIWTTNGSENQQPLPYFNQVENTVSLGAQILNDQKSVPYRTVKVVDAIKITVASNGLYHAATSGLTDTSVDFKIEYKKSTDTTYATFINTSNTADAITDANGKITFYSPYTKSEVVRDYHLTLPSPDIYDVRLTRLTADHSSDPNYGDNLYFKSINEIVTDSLAYPYTAILGIKLKATDQLSGGMPTITSLVKGMKVLVPNIYHPDAADPAQKYDSQTWDGTWAAQRQWTNNPVWCLYDLITNNRYGLGDAFNLDPKREGLMKAQFFLMAKYCDDLVTVPSQDDYGFQQSTKEPRYQLNMVIDGLAGASEWLGLMASAMQANLFYTEGRLWLDIDRSKPISHLFNMSNIVKGSFSVQGTSYKNMPNVYEVQYPNRDASYTTDTFRVESYKIQNDPFTEEQKKSMNLVGVTNVSQCKRLAKYALLAGESNTRLVTFKTGAEGLQCMVGDVVAIQHDVPQWGFGGRVVSYDAAARQLELGGDVHFEPNADYQVQLSHLGQVQDPVKVIRYPAWQQGTSYHAADVVEYDGQTYLCAADNVADSSNVPEFDDGSIWTRKSLLKLQDAPATVPVEGDTYLIGETTNEIATFRVVYLKRAPDEQVEFNCVDYSEDIYEMADDISEFAQFQPPSYSCLADPTRSSVTSVSASERLIFTKAGDVKSAIDVFFTPQTGNSFWDSATIYYRIHGLTPAAYWAEAGVTASGVLTITGMTEPGSAGGAIAYDILAVSNYRNGSRQSISEALAQNPPPTCTVTVYGKMKPPAAPANFAAAVTTQSGSYNVILSWDEVTDLDLAGYEITQITNGTATVLEKQYRGRSYTLPPLTAGNYSWSIRAVDTSGNYSTSTASNALAIGVPGNVTMTYALVGDSVVFNWTAPASQFPIRSYTLTSNGVSTEVSALTFTQKVTWAGSRSFSIKATDICGNSGNTTSVTVAVSAPPAPVVTAKLNGDSVVLSWSAAQGSLPLSTYQVDSSATVGTLIHEDLRATSYTYKVNWTGAKTFTVTSTDVAGNVGAAGSATVTVTAPTIASLTYKYVGDAVVLDWTVNAGSLPVVSYRLQSAATGSSEAIDRTLTTKTFSQKVNWQGNRDFSVQVFDTTGVGSAAQTVTAVMVPPSAVLSPTPQVIDNNVLLKWTAPAMGALPVAYYEIRKGSVFSSATKLGTLSGTFNVIFESQSGNYTYWVVAVDSAGNYGTEVSMAAYVNQPPDYVLYDNRALTWSGTKTNLYTDSVLAIPDVDMAATYSSHFTAKGWSTPQNQIDAGYSFFLQPMLTSGTYSETVDYGAVIGGTKITLNLQSTPVNGSVTVTPTISVKMNSTDAWTVYAGVYQVFATNFRYVKIDLQFNSDDKGILRIDHANLTLDMKQKTLAGTLQIKDTNAGSATVSLLGSSGTPYFVDVQSINVTPTGTTPASAFAIYDFQDVASPQSFNIYLFDATGNRIAGTASWTVRGV